MTVDAIRVVSEPGLLGESPFWHPLEGVLYWCDIQARRVYRLDPFSGTSRHWQFESEPASCAPLLGGDLLLAMRDGLWRFDPRSGTRSRVAPPPYDAARQRFNDGKSDPQGRFWVGTIDDKREPNAALYCWTGGRLRRMAQGITTSNGLAWSLDGRTMYWADTKAHCIHAFDFEPSEGSLSRQRVHRQFPHKSAAQPYGGRPDGAAVDAEGGYWVAMYEGARLLRLLPDGSIDREVRLPVRCPTMPCFGGKDLRTLFITTARHFIPLSDQPGTGSDVEPMSGCVLAMPVDVPGLPVNFVYA